MKTLRNTIIYSLATALLVFGLLAVSPVMVGADTDASDAVCDTLKGAGEQGCGNGGTQINSILRTVLTILSFVAGIAAVIMIIVAGIKFITSRGDSSAVASARSTVIYAIVGIVIVVLSQIIVQFVLSEADNLVNEEETGYIINRS